MCVSVCVPEAQLRLFYERAVAEMSGHMGGSPGLLHTDLPLIDVNNRAATAYVPIMGSTDVDLEIQGWAM
jgi:hypothetical protein